MKRLGEVLYGDKSPDLQAALWLKRVDKYTTVPHIVDGKKWRPIKILDSYAFLENPIVFKNLEEPVSTVSAFESSSPDGDTKFIVNTFLDKPYFYIGLFIDDQIEKIVTEFGEDITDAFECIDTGIMRFNNVPREYNLFEFKIANSLVPLDASITIYIKQNENS